MPAGRAPTGPWLPDRSPSPLVAGHPLADAKRSERAVRRAACVYGASDALLLPSKRNKCTYQ